MIPTGSKKQFLTDMFWRSYSLFLMKDKLKPQLKFKTHEKDNHRTLRSTKKWKPTKKEVLN